MPRTLVTGATGFVGRNLVQRLRSRGDEVRCLVRKTANTATVATLTSLGAECVSGDVTDPASLPAAVADVDVVYHVAGLTHSLDVRDFVRVNCDGPCHLAEACSRNVNPPVLISVSSLAAAGPSPFDRPRSEVTPPQPVSYYGRSKLQGEIVLHPFADRVPITIVRPPGVFGAWDVTVLEAYRLVKHGWHLVPGWTRHRVALVDVADLVEALITAGSRGQRLRSGSGPDAQYTGYYFTAHPEQPSFAEIGTLLAEALDRNRPWTVKVPGPLCWAVAACAEGVARFRRKPALFSFDKIREAVAGSWICDITRARTELGFAPAQSLGQQLRDTAAWYRDRKWL
jgi:nucleoside-diphosphate-sugar epimerase